MRARLQRVEELLRREIANVVLFGELRDPRLQPTSNVSITGVRVSADLGSARVFVDVLSDAMSIGRVLEGLNAGAGLIRKQLGQRITLKRTPSLRFEHDESVTRGASIEQTLVELRQAGSMGEDEPTE